MDVAEHLGGIILQRAGDIDIPFQIHAHHGFELPKGQHHRTLRIIDVGDGSGDDRLCPRVFKFGGFLRIVTPFGLDEVLHGVLIHFPIDIEGLLGEQDGVIGLLHLGDHVQP